MSPFYKEIVTSAKLTVTTTDSALIAEHDFDLWMIYEGSDTSESVQIEIKEVIPLWRNLPIDNDVYDTTYQIGGPIKRINFDQDRTHEMYTVNFYDTTVGSSLPSSAQTTYTVKTPHFKDSVGPPEDAKDY